MKHSNMIKIINKYIMSSAAYASAFVSRSYIDAGVADYVEIEFNSDFDISHFEIDQNNKNTIRIFRRLDHASSVDVNFTDTSSDYDYDYSKRIYQAPASITHLYKFTVFDIEPKNMCFGGDDYLYFNKIGANTISMENAILYSMPNTNGTLFVDFVDNPEFHMLADAIEEFNLDSIIDIPSFEAYALEIRDDGHIALINQSGMSDEYLSRNVMDISFRLIKNDYNNYFSIVIVDAHISRE